MTSNVLLWVFIEWIKKKKKNSDCPSSSINKSRTMLLKPLSVSSWTCSKYRFLWRPLGFFAVTLPPEMSVMTKSSGWTTCPISFTVLNSIVFISCLFFLVLFLTLAYRFARLVFVSFLRVHISVHTSFPGFLASRPCFTAMLY